MKRATGNIIKVRDGKMLIVADADEELISKQHITKCDIAYNDGRTITIEQRKKAYATMNDISEWSGHMPEATKEIMKYYYISFTGEKYFSLSDCSVSVARDFIDFLIEFCVMNDIPTMESLLNRCEDIKKYVYACIAYRKCAVCGRKADIHEVNAVGMGNNRDAIHHVGQLALPLCRKHHCECHSTGNKAFAEYYHLTPIKLDENLCERLRWKK